jgi:hypothetical protein
MISSAGQLGTGALSRTDVIPDAVPAKARLQTATSTIAQYAEIGTGSTRSGRGALTVAEFGSNAAGMISIPIFGSQRTERFTQLGDAAADVRGSTAFPRENRYSGSLALKTQVPPEPPAFVQVPSCTTDAGEQIASPTPYVSMIWALVEAQQLPKARTLLQLLPDSPEFMNLKKLLSSPVATASQRKDFDRGPEYRWLANNAKNYAGKWVAVSGDSLIAAADTLKDLREQVKKTISGRSPLLHYVE